MQHQPIQELFKASLKTLEGGFEDGNPVLLNLGERIYQMTRPRPLPARRRKPKKSLLQCMEERWKDPEVPLLHVLARVERGAFILAEQPTNCDRGHSPAIGPQLCSDIERLSLIAKRRQN
jgi:hypothetical protein